MTKKQHFVPRGYLTNFTSNGQKIYAFDKYENKSYPTSINDIAQKNCFYDLPQKMVEDDFQNKKIIEEILAKFDSIHASNLKDVLKRLSSKKRLFSEQKEILADFAALQYLRTNDFRKNSINVFNDMNSKIFDMFTNHTNIENSLEKNQIKLEMDKSDHVIHHTNLMFSYELFETIKNSLLSHFYIIGCNNTNIDLYTSDSPIVLYSHNKEYPYGRGFCAPGIEVFFPISNDYIISYFERSYFKDLSIPNNPFIDLKDRNIEYYNSQQVIEAERFIYCRSDNFSFAKEVISKYPEIADPNKKKFSVT
ncbi:MAG: DUF4238 domain-containing protein [Silvanigrellaceae bacterium]|nr:DUF4238 domain-containing protein [Silvanigrellaceae bacterium]